MKAEININTSLVAVFANLKEALETQDKSEKRKSYDKAIDELEKAQKNLEALYSQLTDEDGEPLESATLEYRKSPKGVETIERVKR